MTTRQRAASRPLAWSLLVFSVVAGTGGGASRCAVAQELSGTITYSGMHAVVSDSEPILIFLVALDPDVDVVDRAYVSTNGGPFVLHAPAAGNYYLFYSIDVHDYRDGTASVGAPFQVYDHRFAFSYPAPPPADPIFVPQAGVRLAFDDTALISGIAGTTTYTGQFPEGDIPPCICVEASSDPLYTPPANDNYCCGNQTRGSDGHAGRFELNRLQNSGTPFYLRVFVDLNDNRQLDPGEPVGTCSSPVVAGPNQTDVAITFGDAGAAMCVVSSPPTPTPTVTPAPGTVTLSGTVAYSGSMGPVSSTRPIVLAMFLPGAIKPLSIDEALISTNPGAFVLHAPEAGPYYLVYALDIRGYRDGSVSVGAPFQFYDHRFVPPGDPIGVPQAGVSLGFNDSQLIPGIAGTVTYTGNRSGGCVIVQAFENRQPEGTPDSFGCVEDDGRYERPFLNVGQTYYLRAFKDVNDNRQLDPGEPFGIYKGKGTPPGDAVVASTTQTNINFTFGDENVSPACVGDCDGTAQVTIDEILTMVNIALGSLDVGTCSGAGDANQDGYITIDEILAAVNNALNGC